MNRKLLLMPVIAVVFMAITGLITYFGLDAQRDAVEWMYHELKTNPGILEDLSNGNSEINLVYQNATSDFTTILYSLAGLLVLSVAALLIAGKRLVNRLLPSIKHINVVIEKMSGGDLTDRIRTSDESDLDRLATHLNNSLDKLSTTVRQFSKGSMLISSSAKTLESSTKKMREGVDETANQVNTVASASEEMSVTSSEIARNCASASASSVQATTIAKNGVSIVRETATIMERIDSIVTESAENIKSLVKRSDQIGGIIELINDIAAQTNLLALNAAIEAARAGEHGRGFAVVSDEVRKLAENTAQATSQVAETINAMQGEMKQAVMSMEEGVKVVAQGAVDARQSDEALRDIMEHIEMVSREIQQIASASEQQTTTATEIAKNMQDISTIMSNTTTEVARNAQASSHMAEFSANINKLIGEFRLFTPEDVKNIVDRAVAYIKQHGKERAFREFANLAGEFTEGELYIYAQDFNGVMLAHYKPEYVGVNSIGFKDSNGKSIAVEMIELVKTKGCGWYEYDIVNPQTEKVQSKIVYCQSMGDYYIASGCYK